MTKKQEITPHVGTLGHVIWLRDVMKNQTLARGSVDLFDIGEICFAYASDPVALQALSGKRAKDAVRKFMLGLSPEDFLALQAHGEKELLKYISTLVVAKKKHRPQVKKASPPSRRKKALHAMS